jgi:flagellar export protein FliJ
MNHTVLDAYQAELFYGYVNHLRAQRSQLQIALSQQTQRVQQAREILKQAVIKKKSLEILKDKAYAQFRTKLEKAEEAFLEELALNRLIHQSKG